MERTIISLLTWFLCTLAVPVFAQGGIHKFGHHWTTEAISTDQRMMVRQEISCMYPDDAISVILDDFKRPATATDVEIEKIPKSPIILAVKLSPDLEDYWTGDIKSITKSYTGYTISDSSEAVLVAMGINEANYKDFRYHVVQDDSVELVKWSIPMLEKDYNALTPYGFLGKFCTPGKQIMVEVVNTKNYAIRDGVIFDWRTNFRPRVKQVIVSGPNNRYFNINYTGHNDGYATRFDTIAGIPLDLHFPVDSVEEFRFEFLHHETVPYVIDLVRTVGGKTDTIMLKWWFSEGYIDVASKDFSKPGKYELIIKRALLGPHPDERQILRIPFEVRPPPAIGKQVSLRQLLPYILGAIALIGLSFTAYYRYSKRRLRKAKQEGETISLQLKSIRSQLNPHFMFNALSAIQGLMNKNDVAGANHYLAKFADLTRQVLHTGETDMISLEDELKILDDYLQMEQLRFGFQYKFDIDPHINRANTEIPVMLLQPFVENAVKHGVSSLLQKGMILISATQQGRTLLLTIRDNGAGFTNPAADPNPATGPGSGFGLKLSAQRIVLLNQKYKAPWVSLDISASPDGTLVSLSIAS